MAVKQRNGLTKAVFFKHADGSMRGYVLRYILDEDYLKKKKSSNDYKKLSLNRIPADYTGYLQFSDWSGKLLNLYSYDNGKIVVSTRSNTANVKNGRLKGCEEVVHWYWVKVTIGYQCCTEAEYDYDPSSVCCIRNYYYDELQPFVEEVCTPDTPNEPGPNDNGGGGDNTNYSNVSNTKLGLFVSEIEFNLQDPCFKSVAKDLINLTDGGTEIFGEKVGQILLNLTSVNAKINIYVQKGIPSTPTDDGDYLAGQNNGTLTLNSNTLSGASKEYIAATLIHELIHGYYNETTGNKLDNTDQHNDMSTRYVEPMAQALLGMYGISVSDATALAWGGLKKTPAYIALSATQKNQIALINSFYKRGTAGQRNC